MSSNLPSPDQHTEAQSLAYLMDAASIDHPLRQNIVDRAAELVERIREDSDPGVMELFLGEYGLSSEEGVALMCLAEALLRVPDGATMDALIEDKIAPSEWGQHLGQSHSSLVNASTWALFVTGKVLDEGDDQSIAGTLRALIKRLGEPVIRQAVTRVMKEMGRQFVLGETIESAIERAARQEAAGYTYSYDMLGEAARTQNDAERYHVAYGDAISELAKHATHGDIRQNPGISIKLSALHPRYETLKRKRVLEELMPRARSLAVLAKSAGIGLNIDAEEAGRLDLSLDVIEDILSDPVLKGWDGFGVVVQAYNRRASHVLDALYALASRLDRRIMIRLVKGAYWDTEIKLAQVEGHETFSVFTRKASTDVSYICCAQKLLAMSDRIYPQFATHNAHTIAAILEMAADKSAFEFQRLHGMGEALHDTVMRRQKTRCRIYAPVGAHRDLLAYLVRRLLENGANSSFVNQIVDENVPPEVVAEDPFAKVEEWINDPQNPLIRRPQELFAPGRTNSRGWDLTDPATLSGLESGIGTFETKTWSQDEMSGDLVKVTSPANGKMVGSVRFASSRDVSRAADAVTDWSAATPDERSAILLRAAQLYEDNAHELFALLMREAGKTLLDCVGELREAVDFLRYYASQAHGRHAEPVGIFACISPWNFPLAIFTGQISAALAMGNGVLAKPAESTSLIAGFAVDILHRAGVPRDVLKLLPGTGSEVGAALGANSNVDGICFTGSTATAQRINQSMAENLAPHAPFIAETGGLNAMIVDSTALPEQAVRDILASAFQSAGQRCSALRILYLQKDIEDAVLPMLLGAMDELQVGDPWNFDTDVGPIIDRAAAAKIQAYVQKANVEGRLIRAISAPDHETFVAPTVLRVDGIADLEEEIFGPVLHVATFNGDEIDAVIDAINAKGYGLTFGLHSRIDDRVQQVIDRIEAGNIYVNRNQIGAVVGSKPFGGHGLSGTGTKAGGPLYLDRFAARPPRAGEQPDAAATARSITAEEINAAFNELAAPHLDVSSAHQLPGPTGESNRHSLLPRGNLLCLGPGADLATQQAEQARAARCRALALAPGVTDGLSGTISPQTIAELVRLDGLIYAGIDGADYRRALAAREGPIVPLISNTDDPNAFVKEKHVCIDTTAAGGNAQLLGAED